MICLLLQPCTPGIIRQMHSDRSLPSERKAAFKQKGGRIMRKKFQLSLLMIFLLGLIFLSYYVLNDHSRYVLPAEGIGRYTNGLAQRPLMGWSSWSDLGSFPTESKIQTQAQALARTLKSHGYIYVNLDDYWYLDPATTIDQFGGGWPIHKNSLLASEVCRRTYMVWASNLASTSTLVFLWPLCSRIRLSKERNITQGI